MAKGQSACSSAAWISNVHYRGLTLQYVICAFPKALHLQGISTASVASSCHKFKFSLSLWQWTFSQWGKNGGNKLTLDLTEISFWASNSLSQSFSHVAHVSPGCAPSICQFYSQQINHRLTMSFPGSFHSIPMTLFSVSGVCIADWAFRISLTNKVL